MDRTPRPALVGVDVRVDPPTMLLRFESSPRKYVTVRVKTFAHGKEDLRAAAQRELEAFTDDQLELLADVAQPDPAAPPAIFEAAVQTVNRTGTYKGRIHCPGCGAFLAVAENPSLGYVEKCYTCHRELTVRVRGDEVHIVIRQRDA